MLSIQIQAYKAVVENQQSVSQTGLSTFLSFGAKTVRPEILEQMLVGRQQTVGLLEQYAREIAHNSVNHQVFVVGPRGSGKTHMLRVLYHRIRDLVTQRAVVVAYFAEEEYGISGYLDFLIRVINAFMRWYDHDREKLESQLDILRETPERRQEYVAETIISDYVGDKPLLILSENFDAVLEALAKKGQDKLRAWLYQHNRISIIATSQSLSPDLGREDRPFYGFFSTIRLTKLTYEQSLELLQNLAQIEQRPDMIEHLAGKGRAQVRAIYELVKGNHRLLVTFYEFLKAESMAELSVIFIKTMNDLNPYYETFIRFLPPQQQKIVHYLALAKIPQRGTDIAKNCFIATTSLTKQLSELQRRHLLDALNDAEDKRNKLYDVSEPLLRIAIEIGEQREGIAALFIDFLALYYSHEEIKNQKEKFENLYHREDEPYVKQKFFWEVKAREKAMELQIKLGLVKVSKTIEELMISGNDFYINNQYDKALVSYLEIVDKRPDYAWAWDRLGGVYHQQNNQIKAIEAYQNAIKIDDGFAWPWYGLGNAYSAENNYSEALRSYQAAIRINPEFAWGWLGLGKTYTQQNNYNKAIQAYQRAIKSNINFEWVWDRLGDIYIHQSEYIKAVEAYQKAIEINPSFDWGWYDLGRAYMRLKEYVKAVTAFQEAIMLNIKVEGAVTSLTNALVESLQSQISTREELINWENWLLGRKNLEIIYKYVQIYRRFIFDKEENVLYELPKEQRGFFEKEILKRNTE